MSPIVLRLARLLQCFNNIFLFFYTTHSLFYWCSCLTLGYKVMNSVRKILLIYPSPSFVVTHSMWYTIVQDILIVLQKIGVGVSLF